MPDYVRCAGMGIPRHLPLAGDRLPTYSKHRRKAVRSSLQYFAAIAIAVGWMLGGNGQLKGQQSEAAAAASSAQPSQAHVSLQENATDPMADPRAVIVF